VKGVFIRLDDLIHQIQVDQTQRQNNQADEKLAVSIFISSHNQGQLSTEINGQFIHFQHLIDCLLRMESSEDERREFIAFCKQVYKSNPDELTTVNQFERDYSPDQSLWWYTKNTFLYRLLNKALRVGNIDLLYLFRFFIRDLEQQLEKNRCSLPIRAYRGQKMSKKEIEMLQNCIGDYISINSFLSTSLNRNVAQDFLFRSNQSDDVERVLFEIDADPRLENIKPFSNITSLSFYRTEEEVLFTIGSIFRLVEMKHDSNGIWNIRVILCSENDHQLQSLFQHTKTELDTGGITLLRFGHILRRMGKLDDAEKYYHRYLNRLPFNHPDMSNCYNALGKVADAKSDYEKSLEWYNKSLEIEKQILDLDHPNIAATYNSIAIVYSKKGDRVHALESYEKALKILTKNYGDDHIRVAECFNNMGEIYYTEKNYSKALEYHQKALAIRQRHLPPNHHHVGSSLNNIANIDRCQGHYDQALKNYELSLEIKLKSLPPQHSGIAMAFENIGLVYEDKNDFPQARIYFEKAAKIYHHSFSPTDPHVINIDQCIARISSKM
jgi:tetratricopeptide (TPR) repeat protein